MDAAVRAQTRPFSFYYQNVPIWNGASTLSSNNVSDFNRLRVMSEPVWGDVSAEIAYEQLLTARERPFPGAFAAVGAIPEGGEWLDLQWTISEGEHHLWRHRFDRLNLGWRPTDAIELSVGRQAISWATTAFLTPADPFAPFDPADPFQEFRRGVDALRVQVYPSPLSELDVVVRPTKTIVGDEMTVLGRGLTTVKGWELSGWGGRLYGEGAGAVGVSGSLLTAAVRGEVSLREKDDEIIIRSSFGVDRRFSLFRRDFVVLAEYQHDGFGASSPDEYLDVFVSKPFLRGEQQVRGENETLFSAAYSFHPLWGGAFLWLANLSDGSHLLSPSFAYSLGNETTMTGGMFLGLGDDRVDRFPHLPSEYGAAGTTLYFSVSTFF